MAFTRTSAERLVETLQPGRRVYIAPEGGRVGELETRIADASAWCQRFLDPHAPETSLRPPRLQPHPLSEDRWVAVDSVAEARASDLGKSSDRIPFDHAGRLFVYFANADLCDGAAEAETEGFLDVHNAPPLATWLGYFDDGSDDPSYSAYLLAWIPGAMVERVGRGIAVNPEACIAWLHDTDVRVKPVMDLLRIGAAG